MIRAILSYSFVAASLISAEISLGTGADDDGAPPRDFVTLTHSIQLAELRGGSHQADGPNKYKLLFTVTGYKKTEDGKKPDEQKPDTFLASELNSIDLPPVKALEYIRFAGKNRIPYTQHISGDALREVVSKSMKKFNTKEDQIEIMVTVKLMELGKIAFFFGSDKMIGEARYFPLSTDREVPSLKPKGTFTIADDKGAYSVFEVEYKIDGKGDRKS